MESHSDLMSKYQMNPDLILYLELQSNLNLISNHQMESNSHHQMESNSDLISNHQLESNSDLRTYNRKSFHQYNIIRHRWSMATLTQSDDAEAQRYFLSNEEFDAEHLNHCFEEALSHLAPKCLDIIAKAAKRKKVTLSFTTPYHRLITSNIPDSYKRNANLVECTRVLIDNGFDVHEPDGWYPLYTLVQQARQTQLRRHSLDVEYQSLSLLLAAGANPNFRFDSDEEVFLRSESASAALEHGFAIYPGYSNFHNYKYFAKYVELLVKYGCDVSEKNNNGRSLLEKHFGSFTVNYNNFFDYYREKGVRALAPYWYKTAGCLIYGGADINNRNQGKLPLTTFTMGFTEGIHSYFDRKLRTLNEKERAEKEAEMNKIVIVILDSAFSYLRFMNIGEAQEVLNLSLDAFDLKDQDGKLTNFRIIFKDIFLKHLSSFLSLQTLCMVKVWRCAGKRFTELELAATIVNDIREMFLLTS